MTATSQKNPSEAKNIRYFDGIPVENRGAEGPNLDLRTLNQKPLENFPEFPEYQRLELARQAAIEYGMTETGSGRGWVWSVLSFSDGGFEATGRSTQEGLKKSARRKGAKKSKKRASERGQMSEESIESSLRRSKKSVRRHLRSMCADQMLTFTTRYSFVDIGPFRGLLSRFLGLVRVRYPDFQYLTVIERHNSNKTSLKKLGSLHVHMATSGFVPYNVLRELWRKAVQLELKDGDWEGANMQASNLKNPNSRSLSRYMSKYLTKDLDNEYFEPNKKRYWVSRNIKVPALLTLFSPPAVAEGVLRSMWQDILSAESLVFWAPDVEEGKPPIIWMSSG